MTIKSSKIFFIVVVMFVCVKSFRVWGEGECDNEKPSGNLMACAEVLTCGSYEDMNACLNDPGIFLYPKLVKQDFPAECEENATGWNCNEPLRQCYRNTLCQWSNGVCIPTGLLMAPWTSVKKKEGVKCGTGGEEGEIEE
ncbi:hypothetical protein SH449x_003445 [Pirellulaceae bacterium SH449]